MEENEKLLIMKVAEMTKISKITPPRNPIASELKLYA
jgi:hypothetical protein